MKIKNLILGSILFIAGLFMAILPKFCMKIIVIIVGAYMVFSGCVNLAGLKKSENSEKYRKTVIIRNLITILIGLLAIICPFVLLKTFAGIWTFVSYLLAVCLVGFSISGFFSASMLSNEKSDLKKRITSESFISLLIAVLMFIIPIESIMTTAFIVIGIAVIIIGLIFITIEVLRISKAKKASDDVIEVKAEVSDKE
ncbi:MAG: DUF308 domain-containing protein [Treponema sp.]|nr:DUF308 domain-containing protein [Treponema sp.]